MGLPKAASTFLQKWFLQNQENVSQSGLRYPTNHFLSGLGHHPLFLTLLNGQDGVSEFGAAAFRQTWAAFMSFYRGSGEDIFISSELAMLAAQRAGTDFDNLFFEVLDGVDYKLVLNVRPHAELIQSAYNQLLKKSHYIGSISELLANYGNEILSFCDVINRLAERATEQRIIMLDASKEKVGKYSVIDQFFNSINLQVEADLYSIEGKANVSSDAARLQKKWYETMIGKRKYNPILGPEEDFKLQNPEELVMPSNDFFELRQEQRTDIDKRYQGDWDELWRQYG